MKTVIQRVSQAQVISNSEITGKIGTGLVLLVGFEEADTLSDIEWTIGKILNLRIFPDTNGVMNININDTGGEILAISQFTLHASTKKGNRPSYIKAAKPEIALPLYEKFIQHLQKEFNRKIETGIFGADMLVSLTNNGPVTIIMDSKNKE
jgi:D-tyrosyl-tRNA(Tyr) deacylase